MVLIRGVAKINTAKSSLFPSPCGDYGSYLTAKKSQLAFITKSFRPLAGIMVLIKGGKNIIKRTEL